MQKSPYLDSVMGVWKFDKKASTKDGARIVYTRSAKATLTAELAQDYVDPKTGKKNRVYGDVILNERKVIDGPTGKESFFRDVNLTETSIKEVVL